MKKTICAACGAGVDLATTHLALYRIPPDRAVRFGGVPGTTGNLALRLYDRCFERPQEELERVLEVCILEQVDVIIALAARNNTLPERCGYCGGPADMAHVQGHRHGCDVLFGSCESCRQEIADAEREVE